MAVKITYMTANVFAVGLGDPLRYMSIGACKAAETLAVPSTGAYVAENLDVAIVVSTEAATIICAHGTTPDAATLVANASSGAGYAIPPGIPFVVAMKTGDKINIKAFA